jgi:hypothetical protein
MTWAPDDTSAMKAANRTYGVLITSSFGTKQPKPKAPVAPQCSEGKGDALAGQCSEAVADTLPCQNTQTDQAASSSTSPSTSSSSGSAQNSSNSSKTNATLRIQGDSSSLTGAGNSGGILDSLRQLIPGVSPLPDGVDTDAVLGPAETRHLDAQAAIRLAVRAAGPLMGAHYR